MECFEQYRKIDPDDFVYSAKGDVYYEQKEYDKALEYYD